MGKRLIEHGAMCYFNCAQELRELLNNSQVWRIGKIREKIKYIREVNAIGLKAPSLRHYDKHESINPRNINKIANRRRNYCLARDPRERWNFVVTNRFQLGRNLSDEDKVMVDYYVSHLKTPNV